MTSQHVDIKQRPIVTLPKCEVQWRRQTSVRVRSEVNFCALMDDLFRDLGVMWSFEGLSCCGLFIQEDSVFQCEGSAAGGCPAEGGPEEEEGVEAAPPASSSCLQAGQQQQKSPRQRQNRVRLWI
ncbi:hypothetical protein Q5P01_014074 [Channa striata]|uniref:Uncharacterized protein n=1 Tax=Channa striata TaxID=64152 RepID=A0AA88MQ75_CHASR|nr:hypothetical protein Q5P01_014074 [Channa striata]